MRATARKRLSVVFECTLVDLMGGSDRVYAEQQRCGEDAFHTSCGLEDVESSNHIIRFILPKKEKEDVKK
ncbi:MAG: hypothetical protein OD814_001845 [Candidatus Alkanophagales archaeon MCA70_species_1]|nr:hypothetical protein [Candidatus Alkanophaga volatiphilum]